MKDNRYLMGLAASDSSCHLNNWISLLGGGDSSYKVTLLMKRTYQAHGETFQRSRRKQPDFKRQNFSRISSDSHYTSQPLPSLNSSSMTFWQPEPFVLLLFSALQRRNEKINYGYGTFFFFFFILQSLKRTKRKERKKMRAHLSYIDRTSFKR